MSDIYLETRYEPPAGLLARQYEADASCQGTLAQLVQYVLDRHHAYLKSELPRLEGLLLKLAHIRCERHGAMLHRLRGAFDEFKLETEIHMHKEEAVLFPAILQIEAAARSGSALAPAAAGSFANVIRMMSREHDSAESGMERIREIADGYRCPPDAGETLRSLLDGLRALDADLRFHVHLEDDVLFRRALDLSGAMKCA